jgi:type II secretory pathway pseudopilin PulG
MLFTVVIKIMSIQDLSTQFALKRRLATTNLGVTLVETIVSATVAAVALAGIVTMAGQTFGTLKRSADLAGATQSLQQRIEQVRGSGWTEIVAEEPPDTGDDDAGDDAFDDNDETGDPVTTLAPADPTDSMASEFTDDLSDLSQTTPGFAEILAQTVESTQRWNWTNLVEEAYVNSYPTASATPIRVVATMSRNTSGSPVSSVDIKSHNADLYYADAVRVAITLTWTSPDGRTHRQQSQTIIARSVQ